MHKRVQRVAEPSGRSSDEPGRPGPSVGGIFYGWWNVAASFVGLSLSHAMYLVIPLLGLVAVVLVASLGKHPDLERDASGQRAATC